MAPGTLWKSEYYLSNNRKSTPCSSHKNTRKPAPAATKIVLRPSSSMSRRKRLTPCNPMMSLSQVTRRGRIKRKYKSDQTVVSPSEDGGTYGIDRLNLEEPENDSESNSKLLLSQCREVHIENKKDRNNSTKREFNVISYF